MTKLQGKAKSKARRQKVKKTKDAYDAYKRLLKSQILKYDSEILAQKCDIVESGTDVSDIVSKMKKVLGSTENGVGLAASQIGILSRIIAIKPDANKYDTKIMINPEIISHSEEKKYGIEGCLSYPRTFAPIERYVFIEVKYFNENWEECNVKYKEGDIRGIIVQHEIEHLDEGHCKIYDWWKDPEGMKEQLQSIFEGKEEDREVIESKIDPLVNP